MAVRSDRLPLASDASSSVWLPGGEPRQGRIARAKLRSRDDIQEVEKTPWEKLLPGPTIYGCLVAASKLNPDKPAIQHLIEPNLSVPPRTISYAELIRMIEQAANLFHAASAGKRPAVAVILPMVPESLIATWAATTAGIAAPINPFLEVKHIAAIMNAAQATVLVTATAKYGDGAWTKLANIKKLVPSLREVYVLDSEDESADFVKALGGQPHGKLNFQPPSKYTDEAIYLPTGGTTAAPKLVRMTHGGQLLNAWNMGALMGSSIDDVVGHALPLFHVGGLVTIALRAMIYGQRLVTLTTTGFRNPGVIKHFWSMAEEVGLTTIIATPTTAAALVANAEPPKGKPTLQAFHCGGSTIPVEIVRGFHRHFGIWLREAWGMSEMYGCVTGQPDDGQPSVAGSVGYMLPYHTLKVVTLDEDTNTFVSECKAGERGTLIVSGAAIAPGYVERELDAAFFVKNGLDGRLWINTGDLGTIDQDHHIWLFGRAKDLIIRGGHNIDPAMIEEVLAAHPAVELSGAIGRPDASKGEMPMAYVQLRKGTKATSEELIDFCRERIQERASAPVEIVIWDQLPVTPVGKLFKPTLRVDAMRRVATRVASDIVGKSGEMTVTIDESGKRPRAVVAVERVNASRAELRKALENAFQSFGFATDIKM